MLTHMTWSSQSPGLNPTEMLWVMSQVALWSEGKAGSKHSQSHGIPSGMLEIIMKMIERTPRVCKAVITLTFPVKMSMFGKQLRVE